MLDPSFEGESFVELVNTTNSTFFVPSKTNIAQFTIDKIMEPLEVKHHHGAGLPKLLQSELVQAAIRLHSSSCPAIEDRRTCGTGMPDSSVLEKKSASPSREEPASDLGAADEDSQGTYDDLPDLESDPRRESSTKDPTAASFRGELRERPKMDPPESLSGYRNPEPRGTRSLGSGGNGIQVIPSGNPIIIVTPPSPNYHNSPPLEHHHHSSNNTRLYGFLQSWDAEDGVVEIPTNGSGLKEDAIIHL